MLMYKVGTKDNTPYRTVDVRSMHAHMHGHMYTDSTQTTRADHVRQFENCACVFLKLAMTSLETRPQIDGLKY